MGRLQLSDDPPHRAPDVEIRRPTHAADTIVEALRALTGVVPSIREYQAGVDLAIVDGNATVAATATFDDAAGYLETDTIPRTEP